VIHPLVRKELREHWWVLVLMWLLCALSLIALLESARRAGSPLMAYRNLVLYFGPLVALALANRLVVREYGGRTQLFLETLPMGRAQVLTVKWLTGAACLLLPMGACLALILLLASSTVELTTRFIVILALRGAVFLLFIHALAFLVGLTGRYRYVLWMALGAVAVAVHVFGQVPFQQWPPRLLVSEAMPYQREVFPLQALWITGGATAVLIAITYALALGFQGSWVVVMAQRHALREKVTTTAVFISVLYVMVLVQDRKPKPPFSLQDAVASSSDLPRVVVARAEGVGDDGAKQLARNIAEELHSLREYLGLGAPPVVAVLPDVSIDPDLFTVAALPDSDGVVVRGALGAQGFDEAGFRAYTLAHVLDWHMHGRAAKEQRRWLLDGFSRWRIARNDPAQQSLLAQRAAAALQLIESRDGSLEQAFNGWLTTREMLGDCLGDSLAWRATQMLATSLGEQKFRDVSRKLFGARRVSDLRAFLGEQSVDELLQQAGLPGMKVWAGDLQKAMHSEHAGQATALPAWKASFSAVPMRGSTFELHYSLTAPDASPLPPFAVRYTRIGPWEGELARAGMERVDATASGVLPASFPRGERVFTAVELQSPQLACTVRLGARRWEVR
jgi:hypothetical protein